MASPRTSIELQPTSDFKSSSSFASASPRPTVASRGSFVDPRENDEYKVALAMIHAASKGDLQKLEAYLRAGVNPNASGYDQRTALHLACAGGHLDAVKMLLESRADPQVKDKLGYTPFDEAVTHGQENVVQFFQENNIATISASQAFEAKLLAYAHLNNLEEARKLLKAGVNVNCVDYYSRTPLHLATCEGHEAMVRLLLEFKANPHTEDRWGLTPIQEAKRRAIRSGADPIHDAFLGSNKSEEIEHKAPLLDKFTGFFIFCEVAIILLFAFCVKYGEEADGNTDAESDESWANISRRYPLFQDVHVMIFIGFGFLMTFLRKNAYNSLGLTFLICAFCLQWYTLLEGFWHSAFVNSWHKITLTVESLILGDFSAGAVMITYGVVLGKVSPFQMLVTAIFELVFYSLNERIGLRMEITDLGGSIVIHMFGAFFGLAFSLMVSPHEAKGKSDNSAVYHSDVFAMIGTIFLWLFWPSFNGALGKGNTQHRAVINTLFSLTGSCVCAYIASYALRREKKFNMVDIQNATLAGGVAMGSCADLIIGPGPALAIGSIAGVVSVVGYVHVQPWLENKIGLNDTCGVNNLHGMPSLIGAFAGVIASDYASFSDYGTQLGIHFPARGSVSDGVWTDGARSARTQALMQLAYIGITLGISIASGLITGLIVKQTIFNPPAHENLFTDQEHWEVPELETPYYFDKRGEINRKQLTSTQANVADHPAHQNLASQTKSIETRLGNLELRLVRLANERSSASHAPAPTPAIPSPYVSVSIPPQPQYQAATPAVPVDRLTSMFEQILNRLDQGKAAKTH